jgi:hypothetical protein
MLTVIAKTEEAKSGAAYNVERHLRWNGAGLATLLGAFDDQKGFDAFCELVETLSQSNIDADRVETLLRDILFFLSDLRSSEIDHVAYLRRIPAPEMARWHGAKLSELLAGFSAH